MKLAEAANKKMKKMKNELNLTKGEITRKGDRTLILIILLVLMFFVVVNIKVLYLKLWVSIFSKVKFCLRSFATM